MADLLEPGDSLAAEVSDSCPMFRLVPRRTLSTWPVQPHRIDPDWTAAAARPPAHLEPARNPAHGSRIVETRAVSGLGRLEPVVQPEFVNSAGQARVGCSVAQARRTSTTARCDISSFEDAFAHLHSVALNVGKRLSSGDSHRAADIAQETMMHAWLAWAHIVVHPKPEAWVATTARYVALEVSRRDGPARWPIPVDGASTRQDAESRAVACDQLSRALKRLSRRQQVVLVWRYYFDWSVRDTAAALELTASKVKDATHEATTKLARKRGELNGAPETAH